MVMAAQQCGLLTVKVLKVAVLKMVNRFTIIITGPMEKQTPKFEEDKDK